MKIGLRIAVSSPDRPKTPKTYENERPIGVTKSYSSSALHETSILPHTSNHTEDRLPGNALSNERSFTNDRSRSSKREDRRSERHLCTADKIPRGSQTNVHVNSFSTGGVFCCFLGRSQLK
ncbi:hypothetical protein NECAME_13788 [Necator americanus]|uniref:Uncharacterized protein n=1 Tax=Necator americanus TaxID=51031 RepID=W2SUZ0_NECAM|nr:hypothetical protein NECAME_13788 [Necator americanus]ETN72651.1 hypothetical protein NECAME_13788 [Necator americanus]